MRQNNKRQKDKIQLRQNTKRQDVKRQNTKTKKYKCDSGRRPLMATTPLPSYWGLKLKMVNTCLHFWGRLHFGVILILGSSSLLGLSSFLGSPSKGSSAFLGAFSFFEEGASLGRAKQFGCHFFVLFFHKNDLFFYLAREMGHSLTLFDPGGEEGCSEDKQLFYFCLWCSFLETPPFEGPI